MDFFLLCFSVHMYDRSSFLLAASGCQTRRRQDVCKGGECGVTGKQKRFVEEYLIDLNATQAAIRAGYSPDTAYEIGRQNLKKLDISRAISKRIAEQSKRTGITQDRVLQELAKVAFVNITDVVDKDGRIRADAKPDDTAAIEYIHTKMSDSVQGQSVEREVKTASKLKALELLGKHLGMFNDKLHLSIETPTFDGEDDLKE